MSWRQRIGPRVRVAREAAGLTQAELAKQCGLSDNKQVYKLESGRFKPEVETVERIASATMKPLHWFFQEEAPSCPLGAAAQVAAQWEARNAEPSPTPSLMGAVDAEETLRDLREARERIDRVEERLRLSLRVPQPDPVAMPADDLAARRKARRQADPADEVREGLAASQWPDGVTPEAVEELVETHAETYEEP